MSSRLGTPVGFGPEGQFSPVHNGETGRSNRNKRYGGSLVSRWRFRCTIPPLQNCQPSLESSREPFQSHIEGSRLFAGSRRCAVGPLNRRSSLDRFLRHLLNLRVSSSTRWFPRSL